MGALLVARLITLKTLFCLEVLEYLEKNATICIAVSEYHSTKNYRTSSEELQVVLKAEELQVVLKALVLGSI